MPLYHFWLESVSKDVTNNEMNEISLKLTVHGHGFIGF